MRVLFICKRFYTSKDLINDRFGRLYHLPIQLSKLGDEVSVIALDYRNSIETTNNLNGVNFRTEPVKVARLPSVLSALRRSVRASRPDVIVASGDSHIGFAGYCYAAGVGAKFLFDVYDYYPAFPGNRIPGMGAMFRFSVGRADMTFCASTPLMKKLASFTSRLTLIPNGVDRELFSAIDRDTARAALGLPLSKPLVGYFGAITPKRGPLLVEAVRRLRREIPDLSMLLAGRLIKQQITDDFVRYFGELPQDRLPTLISACDVVAVPYDGDPQIDLSGACKISEYLACGKPIVATRVAGHEDIFKDTPSSLCEPDADDLARALRRQLYDPQVLRFPENLEWSHIGLTAYEAIHDLTLKRDSHVMANGHWRK